MWVVRTYLNIKNSEFKYNKYFNDEFFETKDEAISYRKSLNQMSELFEQTVKKN